MTLAHPVIGIDICKHHLDLYDSATGQTRRRIRAARDPQ
jgi:hypothetical protein